MKRIKGIYKDTNNKAINAGDSIFFTVSQQNYPLYAIQRLAKVEVDKEGEYFAVTPSGYRVAFPDIRAVELITE